jgi:hypothetical protein
VQFPDRKILQVYLSERIKFPVLKPAPESRNELLNRAAKGLFILGCILFVASLTLWFSSSLGIFFLVAGIVLMAAGFVLMKKPEYLLLLMGL